MDLRFAMLIRWVFAGLTGTWIDIQKLTPFLKWGDQAADAQKDLELKLQAAQAATEAIVSAAPHRRRSQDI